MTEGKTHSIVVGGTRGHGRAWVRLLCAKGHAVSVLGRRPAANSDRDLSGVEFFTADLSRPRLLGRVLRAISARGPIDSLVFFQRHRGGGEPWDSELATSLTATKTIIDALLGRFAAEGARSIVVVGGSVVNFVAKEQPAGYHVAKAGLYQLMRYYAAVAGPRGLRFNMVSPGAATKEESEAFWSSKKSLLALYRKAIPLGRLGTSKDIAGVIDFLCGPQARYITGQNIVVDGGLSLPWQETLAREVSPLAGQRVTREKR